MEDTLTCSPATFSQVFGRQGQLMQATVQSLNSLNDQIVHFMVTRPGTLSREGEAFIPGERDTLKKSMALMRHLLMDAQGKILKMMEDNKQLAQRIDGAIQSASQEVTNLRSELSATSRRLAELGASSPPSPLENNHQHHQHNHHDHDSLRYQDHRQKSVVSEICYQTEISSLMDFGTPDSSLDKVLLREEVAQLQEEVHLLRQMKDMLSKDLEETQGCSSHLLSATELRVQLGDKEQELDRAKEALQAMKSDRKRLKVEKADLVNQMQQLYTTLESREEQLRDFIRNYDQHRKESEDAVKALAKEKDLLEREKWDLRRQTKEATEQACILRSHMDMKENRIKELEAELTMAKQSLATLTKDVPKRHSLAMPSEPVVNGSQEWAMQGDLPLTAAIRQSQQTLYHGHTVDRQAVVRVSPCHSRQPSIISDASAADGDRSSTPSDINSPRHRTHSLCNSMEDLEDQKRKTKKKEKMSLGSLSRVFARGKQRKSMDPGLFDDSDSLSSLSTQQPSLSDGEEQLDRLQQMELTRNTPMSLWKAGAVQAWLEVVMAMSMYLRACSENVKSGKVLLGLTDEDLELGLGISNPMHRRKLRLAIEDYREAESGQGLSKAAEMDHHWIAKSWLSDVGLPQYSQAFQSQLVDGRVLNSLSRRDLERLLNITTHSHQTSLLLAIQLLQLLNFDKEVLEARRAQCEHKDQDPVVWTCHRVIKWIRDIDLKEYADSLHGRGVHGAVLALDPSFDADAMAKALGIPSHKHMLHRHMFEEMKTLSIPARQTSVEQDCEVPGTGAPPQSPSAVSRYNEEIVSMRRRSGKSPLRFNPKIAIGRGLGYHGSCGSLPREARVQAVPRTKGSPMHTYKNVEITNV
uniref:kazrin, periplakin interacting protein b isoform X1 n=3 Tax=Oncorhynchus gorbuscha TaxID=8017 RepID=UPI001EAEEA0B|nr:kazrin, periplakin interacting protein b isoform X1 [Oncorhynchus gorbuscha]XP_046198868.1 kazrin, periplakin interacting protein b isoform X1 [Oncorhynchus gorbuscha]